ncbi:MAG: DUF3208 family protein [Deinococcota bacterium]
MSHELPLYPDHKDTDDSSDGTNTKAVRLLQGYIWYPKAEDFNLDDHLPKRLEPSLHLLWDEIPPPFTFFDDGTLAATQHIFQFTALMMIDLNVDGERDHPAAVVPWLAETLTSKLEQTPSWVGWQVMEDLRDFG